MKKKKINTLPNISIIGDADKFLIVSGITSNLGTLENLTKSLKNKAYYTQGAYGEDLNDLTEPDERIIYNALNSPKTEAGCMEIKVFRGTTITRILQNIYFDDGSIFYRMKYGSRDWTTWREI